MAVRSGRIPGSLGRELAARVEGKRAVLYGGRRTAPGVPRIVIDGMHTFISTGAPVGMKKPRLPGAAERIQKRRAVAPPVPVPPGGGAIS